MQQASEAEPSRASLEAEIDRVRAAGALGKSGSMLRLFDFLAARTLADQRPNEIEIAMEVFGRSGSFEPGQDAVARVYVHRLRKRLDDFYLRSAPDTPERLTIPRGEYRLILSSASVADGADPTVRPVKRAGWRGLAMFGGVLAAGIALGAVLTVGGTHLVGNKGDPAFVSTPFWSAYKTSKRPLIVVVGDYYIFGQSDNAGNVMRLVREFNVNSREDLYEYMMLYEGEDSAIDLELSYLPQGIADSLVTLAPVIGHSHNTSVIPASQFNVRMLYDNDVLYVGYLSGLRALEGVIFKGSHYRIGLSYDELVKPTSGQRFLSDAARAAVPKPGGVDIGYFASLPGPTGNRVTIIAGTRDTGLAGAAQAATDRRVLSALNVTRDSGVEAVLEVRGKNDLGLDYKVVGTEARNAQAIWPGRD